ncbi:MAG: hypothetical protein GC185_07625 [Alphaproteobacteria bacterium]|nr:hypothetical protein [Alphaproteobacteria bacterium]
MAAKQLEPTEEQQDFISAAIESIGMFFDSGHRLRVEKHRAILAGPARDVYRIRKLDRKIGKLVKPFNDAGRVPPEVVEEIEARIEKLAPSFARVAAVQPAKDLFKLTLPELTVRVFEKDPDCTPVTHLEYLNTFRSAYGNEIEQRVARIRLGK